MGCFLSRFLKLLFEHVNIFKIKEHYRMSESPRCRPTPSGTTHNTAYRPLWNEIKFIDRDPYFYIPRVKDHALTTQIVEMVSFELGKELRKMGTVELKLQNLA